jgi:hypothetical protein
MFRRTAALAAVVTALSTPYVASAHEGRLATSEAYQHLVHRFDLTHSPATVALLHRFDTRPALEAVVFPAQPVGMSRLGSARPARAGDDLPSTTAWAPGRNYVDVTVLVRERRNGRVIVRVVRQESR